MKRPALARLDTDETESREASVGVFCRAKSADSMLAKAKCVEMRRGGWHSTVTRLGRLHMGWWREYDRLPAFTGPDRRLDIGRRDGD